ncbi:MAG: translation elongation factor Ts [bacterium]|nr:translation elongation factor Ts [bacterium]MDA1024697.1 translation elongation factor Ts [bacterium]
MAISASEVMKLRQMTGVGMMEAKNALEEAAGDIDKAIEHLRKRGAAKAAKKADRETAEGRVHTYTHGTGKIGVMLELQCETDFVARNEQFVDLCNDIAMHIAAMSPLYVTREDVPQEVIDKEKEIMKEQMAGEGKSAEMLEKIVDGKMNKFYSEVCLMEQAFIKDEDMTIAQLLEKKLLELGENLKISRFARYQISA